MCSDGVWKDDVLVCDGYEVYGVMVCVGMDRDGVWGDDVLIQWSTF